MSTGPAWQPTEQEMAFTENFTEMRHLLGAVEGSISRLEMLGGALRKCVTASPSGAPPGALPLAAAAENMGQYSSKPSRMGDHVEQPWQFQEEPGPAYVAPHARATGSGDLGDSSNLDGMILEALQQLYPSLQGKPQAQWNRGPSLDGHQDAMLPGRPHAPVAQEEEEKQDPNLFEFDLMKRMPAELSSAALQQRQHDNGGRHQQYDDQRAYQQHENMNSHYRPSASSASSVRQAPEASSQQAERQVDAFSYSGAYASVGSAAHADNTCKPCVFLYNGMCLKGVKCQFCHIPHDVDQVKRVRPSKRTRNLLRQHRDTPGEFEQQNEQGQLQ